MPWATPARRPCLVVLLLGLCACVAAAQQSTANKVEERIEARPFVAINPDVEVPPEAIAAMELGLDFHTIKDRPFRAELIIDTNRRLADGNSIQRRITGSMYRDSLGRVREERAIERPPAPGTPPADIKVNAGPMVVIRDPVARMHYTLFPGAKAGFRSNIPSIPLNVDVRRTTLWTPRPDQKVTHIPLGYQMMDGLQCEGRQETVIIPENAVGNPYPIEVITERWYSTELQINLVVKRIDPRTGETTIRLANIHLEESPPTLFEIPSDYSLKDRTTTVVPMDIKKP